MIWGFGRTKKQPDSTRKEESPSTTPESSIFSKIQQGLGKTKERVAGALRQFFAQGKLDTANKQALETLLLRSDVGMHATQNILKQLEVHCRKLPELSPEVLKNSLREVLVAMLQPSELPAFQPSSQPCAILFVGVNGVGKTTSIGRVAHYLQQQRHSVILAAGDTFRAAAIEQLSCWAQRNNIQMIAQHSGADSASVVYDAYQSCVSSQIDVLLADTAGRLHNKQPLMHELMKIKKTLGKLDKSAPHECWLVLDAGVGQNGMRQAIEFHKQLGLTGIVLTKIDGTAKGGIVFSISAELGLPIRFLGVGEKMQDLICFDPEKFVDAFLAE